MTIKYGTSILIAAGLLVLLGARLPGKHSAAQDGATVRPYTLTLAAFRTSSDGRPVLQYVATKFVRSSSYWKEIRTDVKTQEVRVQQSLDSGVYDMKSDKREFLGKAASDEVPGTPEVLTKHPQFVRTEQIVGLTAYVLRSNIDDQNFGEFYYAPETGHVPLKIVLSNNGGKEKTVVEPMSLTFGEIPDSVFRGPNTPVSYERVQKIIDDAESDGKHDYAEALRRGVAESQKIRSEKHQR